MEQPPRPDCPLSTPAASTPEAPQPPALHQDSTAGSAASESDYESDRAATVNAVNSLAQLLTLLVGCAQRRAALPGDDPPCGLGGETPSLAASSTPGAPLLHCQDVFVSHGQDVTAVFEGLVRMRLRGELEGGSLYPKYMHQVRELQENIEQQCSTALVLSGAAGPGSSALRQCYSFLSSLQRYSAALAGSQTDLQGSIMLDVVDCAIKLIKAQQQQYQSCEEEDAQQQPSSLVMESSAASLLPSLVIIGRYFLQQAAVLQPAAAGSPAEQQSMEYDLSELTSSARLIVEVAAVARQWLQAHSQPLAAAGFTPQAVLQHLEHLLAALEAFQAAELISVDSCAHELVDDVLQQLQQLQLAGAALNCLPVPCMCNNPGCVNAAGMSELGLVSGRSCLCGGCRVARYCGRSCQRKHWSQHKPVCAVLAAAQQPEAAVNVAGGVCE